MEKSIDFDQVSDLYDHYVNTDLDVSFYVTLCKGRKNILELMCGTGRVSLPLLREGCRLTCVDYSSGMLDAFRSKLSGKEDVRLVCQDVCRLDLGEKFDLAFIPFHSFSEIVDADKRRQAVERIYEHLVPNGFLFVSLYNPDYRITLADGELKILGNFPLNGDRILMVSFRNSFSVGERIVRGEQYYEIRDAGENLLETRSLPICFSILSMEEMRTLAREAGFEVLAIYGDYEKSPYTKDSRFMNFLLKKSD